MKLSATQLTFVITMLAVLAALIAAAFIRKNAPQVPI